MIVIGANGGVFNGAIHALDLAIGPRMIGFGEAMINIVASTGVFKGVSAEEFAPSHGNFDVVRC